MRLAGVAHACLPAGRDAPVDPLWRTRDIDVDLPAFAGLAREAFEIVQGAA